MKKFISVLLCCVMCMSVFTCAFTVSAANANDYLKVSHTDLVDGKITYTVSLAPNQTKLTGSIIHVAFDSNVLEVEKGGAAGGSNPYVSGVYETGAKYDDVNIYSMAFMSAGGVTIGTAQKSFLTITFNVIAEDRPVTEVEFRCVEHRTDDQNADNDVARTDEGVSFYSHEFLTLDVPVVNKVYSTETELVAEWDAVEGAESYNVYRKAAGSSSWTSVAANVTDTIYVDGTIEPNIEYAYAVSAVNADGNETEHSATGVAGLNFGTIKTLDAVAAPKGATITWGALELADYYEVYRKESAQPDTAWVMVGYTAETTYTDEDIESCVYYNYKIEAISGNYRAGTSADIPTVRFLAVPETAITNTENGIEIYYGEVNGAITYVIEKKIGDGDFKEIARVDAVEDVFVDGDVVDNGSYTYRIRSLGDGINSAPQEFNAITRLGTPVVKSISVDVPGMTITWSPVAGATQYKIYRKVVGTNQMSVIATATGTSYTDTTAQSNVVYTYTVSAANATGCGKYDPVGKTRIFFASPKLLSRENVVNGVKITWTPIEGATGYRVYRRGAGTNYWHYLGTFSASKTAFIDYGKDVNGKNIGMINGEYYRYTVRATNENRGSSVVYPGGYNQTIYSGFDKDGLYLKYVATPKLVSVTNATAGVAVKWNAVPGAKTYRVYRRGAGSTYWFYLGETSGTTFTDTAIARANGKYYRYTVRAVSVYYSGFDTNGLYLMRLADPALTSARSSKAGITVKWTAITGSTGYYVYRKTPGKTWTRIATVSGVNTTQYVDKTAKKGVTYTYTVRAFCGKNISWYNTKGITCKDVY